MLKHPDLHSNRFFPFYTQYSVGQKKYGQLVRTTMHLSPERGIHILLNYEKRKLTRINLETINDAGRLYRTQKAGKEITYAAFAVEVKTLFLAAQRAVRALSKEQAYQKVLIFSTIVKFNNNIELEVNWGTLTIDFEATDYIISEGKKKVPEKEEITGTNETSQIMKKLDVYVRTIEDHTSYREISNEEFEAKLDGCWEEYIEYFKAPRFLRKNRYVP